MGRQISPSELGPMPSESGREITPEELQAPSGQPRAWMKQAFDNAQKTANTPPQEEQRINFDKTHDEYIDKKVDEFIQNTEGQSLTSSRLHELKQKYGPMIRKAINEPQTEREPMGAVESALLGFNAGMGRLGTSGGAMVAPLLGQTSDKYKDFANEEEAAAQKEHPTAYAVGKWGPLVAGGAYGIGKGLLSGLGLLSAAPEATAAVGGIRGMMGVAGTGAAVGAGLGTSDYYASTHGEDLNASDALSSAAGGAAAGAGSSLALGSLAPAMASKFGSTLRDTFRAKSLQELANEWAATGAGASMQKAKNAGMDRKPFYNEIGEAAFKQGMTDIWPPGNKNYMDALEAKRAQARIEIDAANEKADALNRENGEPLLIRPADVLRSFNEITSPSAMKAQGYSPEMQSAVESHKSILKGQLPSISKAQAMALDKMDINIPEMPEAPAAPASNRKNMFFDVEPATNEQRDAMTNPEYRAKLADRELAIKKFKQELEAKTKEIHASMPSANDLTPSQAHARKSTEYENINYDEGANSANNVVKKMRAAALRDATESKIADRDKGVAGQLTEANKKFADLSLLKSVAPTEGQSYTDLLKSEARPAWMAGARAAKWLGNTKAMSDNSWLQKFIGASSRLPSFMGEAQVKTGAPYTSGQSLTVKPNVNPLPPEEQEMEAVRHFLEHQDGSNSPDGGTK